MPYQFKPGQSGNPGGRPKTKPITDNLIQQLAQPLPARLRSRVPTALFELYGANPTFAEFLAFKLIAESASGNIKAIALLLDRVEGKTPQAAPPTPEPIEFRVIRCNL